MAEVKDPDSINIAIETNVRPGIITADLPNLSAIRPLNRVVSIVMPESIVK